MLLKKFAVTGMAALSSLVATPAVLAVRKVELPAGAMSRPPLAGYGKNASHWGTGRIVAPKPGFHAVSLEHNRSVLL